MKKKILLVVIILAVLFMIFGFKEFKEGFKEGVTEVSNLK